MEKLALRLVGSTSALLLMKAFKTLSTQTASKSLRHLRGNSPLDSQSFLPPQRDCQPLSTSVEHHHLFAHVEAAAQEGGRESFRKESLRWRTQNHEIPNDQRHAEQTQQSVTPAVTSLAVLNGPNLPRKSLFGNIFHFLNVIQASQLTVTPVFWPKGIS